MNLKFPDLRTALKPRAFHNRASIQLFEPRNPVMPQRLKILGLRMPTEISLKVRRNKMERLGKQLPKSLKNRKLGQLGITLLVSHYIFNGLGRSLG